MSRNQVALRVVLKKRDWFRVREQARLSGMGPFAWLRTVVRAALDDAERTDAERESDADRE